MKASNITDRAHFAELYTAGARLAVIRARFPGATDSAISGMAMRMHLHRPVDPAKIRTVSSATIRDGRTIFPSRVRDARDAPNLLVTGAWSTKLGGMVTKGAWRGMPIYSLTLEERATCPQSCHNWSACYGNGMPRAWRNRHGRDLENKLSVEIAALSQKHSRGFVCRLHTLGDFYSLDYLSKWSWWLRKYPALHVFGYTAWREHTDIGSAIRDMISPRFQIRFSSVEPGHAHAITLWAIPTKKEPGIIVCPAQFGKTESCGTCGLCWSATVRHKTIAFVAHGPKAR